MKAMSLLFALLGAVLAACTNPASSVDVSAIQTSAVATAFAAASPTPPPTPKLCTSRGWDDIATYLHVLDEAPSIEVLTNIKAKIADVQVDMCTEAPRQVILSALAQEINSIAKACSGSDSLSSVTCYSAQANHSDVITRASLKARDELEALGITLNYP